MNLHLRTPEPKDAHFLREEPDALELRGARKALNWYAIQSHEWRHSHER